MSLLEKCIEQSFEENPEKYEDWTPDEIESRKKEIYSNIQLKIKKENVFVASRVYDKSIDNEKFLHNKIRIYEKTIHGIEQQVNYYNELKEFTIKDSAICALNMYLKSCIQAINSIENDYEAVYK